MIQIDQRVKLYRKSIKNRLKSQEKSIFKIKAAPYLMQQALPFLLSINNNHHYYLQNNHNCLVHNLTIYNTYPVNPTPLSLSLLS